MVSNVLLSIISHKKYAAKIHIFFDKLHYFTKILILDCNILQVLVCADCNILHFLSGSLYELFGHLFNYMEYCGVRFCAHTFADY